MVLSIILLLRRSNRSYGFCRIAAENFCNMYMKRTVPESFLISFQPVSLQCYLKVSSTNIFSVIFTKYFSTSFS